MRIIQRYLLGELLLNALFTFLVLTSVIAMLLFSITALRMSMISLSIGALLEVVALLTATRLDVILPLTVLIASIWTYGRAQSDGEVTAVRGAGIRLYHILMPSLVLGAFVTLVLAYLQDRIIPEGHYRQRVIGKRHLAESIESLLMDEEKSIQDKRFKARWKSVEKDDEGYIVMRDVMVAEDRGDDRKPMIIRAKQAEPHVDPDRNELTLKLKDFEYGERMAAREMTIRLDLRSLSEEPPPRKRTSNQSYEELVTEASRFPGEEDGREALTEFHRRASTAFSAFTFSLLGALLGLVLRVTNRAYVFTIGFLLVLALHYAPTLATVSLSESGTLPSIAIWSGNALVAALSVVVFIRAFRH